MALEVFTGKIRTTNRSIDQPYIVIDDAHPPVAVAYSDAVEAGLTQAQTDFGTVPYDYSCQRLSKNAYEVIAEYRENATQLPTPQQPGDDARYSFSFQQPAEICRLSKSTVKCPTATAPNWMGLIGVSYNVMGHKFLADGVQVTPRVTDTVEITIDATASWTLAYRKLVRSMLGKVNNAQFLGEDPGTFRFVACRSTLRSDANLNLQFGFDFRPNVEAYNLTGGLGTISIPAYEGHQIFWTLEDLYQDQIGGREPLVVSRVTYAYIETVFDTANLNVLFL